MDREAVVESVHRNWYETVLPSLSRFVEIPAVSANYDPNWADNGQLDAAIDHLRAWIESRGVAGVTCEVVRLPGRSPLLYVDVPAADGPTGETVLLYGHLDKQPPMDGWSPGLGAWKPVVRDGLLYGRGAADDGYAGYAAITAIEAVRAHGGAHARCALLLETGEESGSPDLPAYLDHLAERLGAVTLVVCLDSGAGDDQRLWLTTSLRGMAEAALTVRVLDSGQHSGLASGLVPSSFRVLRTLLDRLEDSATGEVLVPGMTVTVPEDRLGEIRDAIADAPGLVRDAVPPVAGMRLVSEDDVELALNNTWRPTLSVVGADGLPPTAEAGNVLRPYTTVKLSFRLPPTADHHAALKAVRETLTADPPYGARVSIEQEESAPGWNAPRTAEWLRSALDAASDTVFGKPWRTMGLGGSIPFMGLLHQTYPDAQFVVTGALGPGSNAHVPDECLDLEFSAKVTASVACVLHAHAVR